MIIIGSAVKSVPHGVVTEGDILYFSSDEGEPLFCAKGIVSSVIQSDELTREESYETIIRNQDRLQLPDEQFYRIAGKKYLVLIGISGITQINPVNIPDLKSCITDKWIPVGNFEMVKN